MFALRFTLGPPPMISFLAGLPFAAVDPALLPPLSVVRERGRAIIEGLVRQAAGGDEGAPEPVTPWTRERLELALQQSLVSELGPWAEGVFWNASEPGGGGLVRAYCCETHSLFRQGEPGISSTVAPVLAALEEWRVYLDEQARLFETLRASSAALGIEERFITAASELLPMVLARTEATDAWYDTFTTVLVWFADACGYDRARVAPVINEIVSDRFASWVQPPVEVAGPTVMAIGALVSQALAAPVQPGDALASWVRSRGRAVLTGAASDLPVTWDGHRRFIEGAETLRDRARAERMAAALHACRQSARTNEPLDFALLARWQRLVLDHDAPFRDGEAFAKGGRERYGLDEQTRPRFEAWLAEANDDGVHWSLRAARVYLDICFTHPFGDGNARSARLALDYVLTRAGRWLRNAEPIFLLSRSPGDADLARSFAWSIGFCSGASES